MTPEKQKTIFVVISKSVMRRNILETEFWNDFVSKNSDTRIVLIVEEGETQNYNNNFGGSNIVVREIVSERQTFWIKFVLFLVRTGTNTHGVKLYRWRGYELGEVGLPMTLLKSFISNTFGRLGAYKKFVRLLYGTLHNKWIDVLFEEFKPSLVFVPSLIDINIDAMVGATARRRGTYVVGMVRSWDNLSIHGLLPFVPDYFILQNEWLKESAEKYQALDMSKIDHSVIGLPHYDSYKSPEPFLKGRKEFFDEMNLDPNKKLILLGGFDFYWSEDVLPRMLDEAIENNKITEPSQVVFRPHPKTPFKMSDYNIETLKHTTLNAAFLDKKKAFSDKDIFINLIYHCDVLINVASTLSIDAAVFDKPVICVNFDEPSKELTKWKSVNRLFDTFDHYEKLVNTNGVRLPNSFDDMLGDINEYLKNPACDQKERKNIVELFVAPFDGNAGKRLGRELDSQVKKLP